MSEFLLFKLAGSWVAMRRLPAFRRGNDQVLNMCTPGTMLDAYIHFPISFSQQLRQRDYYTHSAREKT